MAARDDQGRVSTDALRDQIGAYRQELSDMEAELRRREREELDSIWFPQGFYGAYYVLSGLVLGVIAAWAALLLNAIGAPLFGESSFELLRTYSTILGGESSATSSDAVAVMFALGVHTFTGAVCGAPIHVVYSRYFMGQSLGKRIAVGVALGIVMWLVNFYGVLSWLQPMLHEESSSYIVEHIPVWVAILNHVLFTTLLLLMQPFAIFNTRNYPAKEEQPEPAPDAT